MLLRTLINKHPAHKDQVLKIVEDLLNFSKEDISLAYNKISLSPYQVVKINHCISKLKQGIPVPYLTQTQFFYGNRFNVNQNVLIPRFETEVLTSKAIEILKKIATGNIIDIGTGSGNIIISISKATKKSFKYYGVDISKKALRTARKNAIKNGTNNIDFLHSDLFSNKKLPEKFDLIVANLPYLDSDYLKKLPKKLTQTLQYEPSLALDGGADGLDIIKKLLNQVSLKMYKHSVLIIEIGDNHIEQVNKICTQNSFEPTIIHDLNNFSRFVVIKKKTHQA